jgi:2-polyprenyl-3-methyl-5-hydroxy-6-metoxy-1,4-benzoquinol methylase
VTDSVNGIENFRLRGSQFSEHLRREKARITIPDYGWYPYDSLALLPEIAGLFKDDFPEIWDLAQEHGALDLGCGDGDFGALLAAQGISTDAVDHAETNFNQMRGVQTLQPLFAPMLN